MSTPEQIKNALSSLDVGNDNHWTGDGLPRLDTVKMLSGDQSVTRDAVTQAAPGFTRTTAAVAPAATPAVTPSPVAETAPAAPTAAATPEAPVAPVVQVAPVTTVSPGGLPPPESTSTPASSPSFYATQPRVDMSEALMSKGDELILVEAQLTDLNRDLASLNKQKQELITRSDSLRLEIEKLTPRDDHQQAIVAYQTSQLAILQRRGQQQANLRKLESELGIRIADILPRKSPIDAAMSRKTGYGGQRPK